MRIAVREVVIQEPGATLHEWHEPGLVRGADFVMVKSAIALPGSDGVTEVLVLLVEQDLDAPKRQRRIDVVPGGLQVSPGPDGAVPEWRASARSVATAQVAHVFELVAVPS